MAEHSRKERWTGIADALRDAIQEGVYPPGAHLPPEKTLAGTHDAHIHTIRRALDQLRIEGLIHTAHGRGTVVRAAPHVRRFGMDRYQREAQMARGGQPTSPGADYPNSRIEPKVELIGAERDLVYHFGVPEGTPLVKRRLLVSVMDIPQLLQISYFLRSMVDGSPLALETDETEGHIAELARLGVQVTAIEEAKFARMPTYHEAQDLKIVGVAPVLAVRRRMFAGDQVVEVAHDIVYPGDRIELVDRIEL